jgi:Ulp1 family protease
MQDNGYDCGVFLCKYLLAMYQLQYDSIPFCTLFGSDAPLQFLTESVWLQLVYASSQVVFDDVSASEEIMSDKEWITDARNAHENSNAEDNFQVKFTSINLEKEIATVSMKARFYDILEMEYKK